LPFGLVDSNMLRQALSRLFNALPMFHEMYPDVSDPVRNVAFPDGKGAFAFVEFFDEVVTTTAVLLSGFELCGRSVKIGRPQGYQPPPYGELPPLDVEPLRHAGLLPVVPEVIVPNMKNVNSSKIRELYFGNLAAGRVTEQIMMEFLTPACMELPEYDARHGAPITKVSMASSGTFCFVEFQNPDMASRLIAVFDETEFFGRKIRVGRPANYGVGLQHAATSLEALPAPLQAPPALPAPPAESEAFLAGAAAASDLADTLL